MEERDNTTAKPEEPVEPVEPTVIGLTPAEILAARLFSEGAAKTEDRLDPNDPDDAATLVARRTNAFLVSELEPGRWCALMAGGELGNQAVVGVSLGDDIEGWWRLWLYSNVEMARQAFYAMTFSDDITAEPAGYIARWETE